LKLIPSDGFVIHGFFFDRRQTVLGFKPVDLIQKRETIQVFWSNGGRTRNSDFDSKALAKSAITFSESEYGIKMDGKDSYWVTYYAV
jgi:hypothetical protein